MLPDSRDLHARVTDDPDHALTTLAEEYGQPLFDYCLAVVGDVDMAIDAASGAIATAVHRTHEVADPADFGVWLFSHAREECLLLIQMSTRGRHPRGATGHGEGAEGAADFSPSGSTASVDVQLVRQALASLNGSDREILVLKRGFSFDRGQIAWIMGVSRANADARFARADGHLGEAIDAQVLLTDPPGSCSALDDLMAGSEEALALGRRRLVLAHVADCPECAARAADVRPLYAMALAASSAFLSDFDATQAIEQRLAGGAERRRRSAARTVAMAGPAAKRGAGASEPNSGPTHQRKWWLPASAAVLLVGGTVAWAASSGPAEAPTAAAAPALLSPSPTVPDVLRRSASPAPTSSSKSPSPSGTAAAEADPPDPLEGAIAGAATATGAAVAGQSGATGNLTSGDRPPSTPAAQPSPAAATVLPPQTPRVTFAPQAPVTQPQPAQPPAPPAPQPPAPPAPQPPAPQPPAPQPPAPQPPAPLPPSDPPPSDPPPSDPPPSDPPPSDPPPPPVDPTPEVSVEPDPLP